MLFQDTMMPFECLKRHKQMEWLQKCMCLMVLFVLAFWISCFLKGAMRLIILADWLAMKMAQLFTVECHTLKHLFWSLFNQMNRKCLLIWIWQSKWILIEKVQCNSHNKILSQKINNLFFGKTQKFKCAVVSCVQIGWFQRNLQLAFSDAIWTSKMDHFVKRTVGNKHFLFLSQWFFETPQNWWENCMEKLNANQKLSQCLLKMVQILTPKSWFWCFNIKSKLFSSSVILPLELFQLDQYLKRHFHLCYFLWCRIGNWEWRWI